MAVFLLALSEFSLYFSSLFQGFVADDYAFQEVHKASVSSFWTHPVDPQGHWRPLT